MLLSVPGDIRKKSATTSSGSVPYERRRSVITDINTGQLISDSIYNLVPAETAWIAAEGRIPRARLSLSLNRLSRCKLGAARDINAGLVKIAGIKGTSKKPPFDLNYIASRRDEEDSAFFQRVTRNARA